MAGSTLPSAVEFERKIFEEILPAIRKTGSYHHAKPTATNGQREALKLSRLAMQAAKAFGFKGNMAALSADHAVRTIVGESPLALMGHSAMRSEAQEQLLTPSDIGERLGIPVRAVNEKLTETGLQMTFRDSKNRLYYELTEPGQSLAEYLDTGKRHGDGTPVRQIKWHTAVLDWLRAPSANAQQAAS